MGLPTTDGMPLTSKVEGLTASLFTTTFCQWYNERECKIWIIVSTWIYTPYASTAVPFRSQPISVANF